MGSEETFVTIRSGSNIGVRSLLLIIAIICFIVAAPGIDVGRISVVAVGLAFFAAAFLVEDRRI
jgi:methyl coenzyme M reductase beta subunit